jgi:hypothetical protein
VKASEGLCIEEHFLTCCLKSHTVSVAVQMFGYICIIFTLHHNNSGHQPTILKKLTSTVLNLIKFLSFTMCILLPGKNCHIFKNFIGLQLFLFLSFRSNFRYPTFFTTPICIITHTTANFIRYTCRIKKPNRCHLIFYCTSYRLNMFRALLCPSSGARDYDFVYHIGRIVLGLL